MDITRALLKLVPNASFSVENENYDEIIWYSEDIPKPTRAQVEAKIQEFILEEPMRLLRIERDRLLAETDWISSKYYDLEQPVPEEWKSYRQALRDLPTTATPVLDPTSKIGISDVDWPVKPQ